MPRKFFRLNWLEKEGRLTEAAIAEGVAERVDGGVDVAEEVGDGEEEAGNGVGIERLVTDDHWKRIKIKYTLIKLEMLHELKNRNKYI